MRWLRWELGRQGGGYDKLLLARSKLLRFDLYVIRLPTGSVVKVHQDSAPEGTQHHRVNWTLRFAEKGGETYVDRTGSSFDLETRRIYRFRPDVQPHCVTPIERGSILMVSLGWLSNSK